MDLLEDLRISLLNFTFVMIYIIIKMLALIKNRLNYLYDTLFEYLFKCRFDILVLFLDFLRS